MNRPSTVSLSPSDLMEDLLGRLPGARRALFSAYHIGGCQSCAYREDETLAEVCARNEIDIEDAIATLRASHERDQAMLITPAELRNRLEGGSLVRLFDLRTREEHEAVPLEGSTLLTQQLQNELFAESPKEEIVLFDHRGRDALDRAARFHGHGLTNTFALAGGIDAWSREVDPSVPRYRLEMD